MLSVFLLSCQDTKTNDSKTEGNSKVEKKKEQRKSLYEQEESTYRLDTIRKISQEKLMPFLERFGKDNPEKHVRIKTDFGDIDIELFENTPLHRANFIRMIKLGYFDTTYFYRVAKNFVIQAGNGDDEMTARMRKRIGKFLIPKEFHEEYKHDYGMVSAAKYTTQNVSKASSPFEFFIVVDKDGAHHLDHEHTIFGKVTRGMGIAQKIAAVETNKDSEWPAENIEIKIEILD